MNMKRPITFLLGLLFLNQAFVLATEDVDSLKAAAKNYYGSMEFRDGSAILNRILEKDSNNLEANYLKAEMYLLYGSEKYFLHKNRLKRLNACEELDILATKEAFFLGLWKADSLLAENIRKYPGNPELEYLNLLGYLKENNYQFARDHAAGISKRLIMKFAPYYALFSFARAQGDAALSLQYLDSLEMITGEFYHSRNRPVLELLSALPHAHVLVDEIELEYADCGAGMGFLMYDENGNTVKAELDTGTSGGLFSIHSDSVGKMLAGRDTLLVEDGIQYNYMTEPADLRYKLVNFAFPFARDFPVAYFDGRFTKADGCFSPFAFAGYALSIDPVNRTVFLRSEQALNKYLDELEDYVTVDYVNRGGWIYIPCRVNGQEVLMMVETGSRDVNLNSMSLKHLNVEPYIGSIRWRGKDYPMEKVDFTLEIGDLKYEVKGGLVSEFVLGNAFYRLASSGDIGPDFFRNYAFTIDPFHRQMIIEKNMP